MYSCRASKRFVSSYTSTTSAIGLASSADSAVGSLWLSFYHIKIYHLEIVFPMVGSLRPSHPPVGRWQQTLAQAQAYANILST
ncbi:hypothetical protein CONLIGDRAFT_637697 [Coniochaeta ligniaria NRRL 30616]|uniref:Uncharacterized protein n=1 Tax=Coniochaeta ligniaria NRRL 30616 TaxID=1408157 RepID=A0A1J7J6T8_9PEZI|nr:hypothetical protein CONLIGDRAFT_637697 [Coniochaeta ligniaria NRRL 30616]